MSLSPLLAAGPVISLHAFAALAAFVLGVIQFAMPKGTGLHRIIGYIWCALMVAIAGSSFGISTLHVWGRFSPIHLISVFVLLVIPYGIYRARTGNIEGHRKSMTYTFFGALIVAGAFTLLPNRIMHEVVFGAPPALNQK